QQADEHDVIDLQKRESGNYEVALPGAGAQESRREPKAEVAAEAPEGRGRGTEVRETRKEEATEPEVEAEGEEDGRAGERRDVQEILDRHRVSSRREATPAAVERVDEAEEEPAIAAEAGGKEPESEEADTEGPGPEEPEEGERTEGKEPAGGAGRSPARSSGRGLGPRRGERPGRKSKKADSGPPILPGQIVGKGSSGQQSSASRESSGGQRGPAGRRGSSVATASPTTVVAPEELGLPTDEESVVRYLTNSYKGVGEKTAETLVEELGSDLFSVLQRQPERIRDVLPSNRADQLLDAWQDDLSRRKERARDGE
ncbi:MAG: hypothetical protein ACLFWG_07520, partial [Longimicrobiales bacterium]